MDFFTIFLPFSLSGRYVLHFPSLPWLMAYGCFSSNSFLLLISICSCTYDRSIIPFSTAYFNSSLSILCLKGARISFCAHGSSSFLFMCDASLTICWHHTYFPVLPMPPLRTVSISPLSATPYSMNTACANASPDSSLKASFPQFFIQMKICPSFPSFM